MLGHGRAVDAHAGLAQHVQKAGFTVGHALVQWQRADDADGAMAQLEDVLRGETPTLAIVGTHRRDAWHGAVDQHHGEALFDGALNLSQDRAHLVAEAVDRAGELLRAHEVEIGRLTFRVVLAVAEHQRVPALADAVLGAEREGRESTDYGCRG